MTNFNLFKGSVLSFVFLSFLFFQCTSDLEFENLDVGLEELNNEFLEVINNQYSDCLASFDDITSSNGVLSFNDKDHVNTVTTCLENMVDSYNNLYIQKFSHLTLEELDSLDESLHFDESFILEHFAQQYDFLSLQSITAKAVNDWLETENPDWENDPSDKFPVGDFVQTIVNVNCEIIVNGELFNLCEYEEQTLKDDSGKRVHVCFDHCCIYGYTREWITFNNNTRRIKLKVEFTSNAIFGANGKGKIVHYTRRSRNRWKRSRANIGIQSGGIFRNENCDPVLISGTFGKSKGPKRRKEIAVRYTNWRVGPTVVRSGDVCATGEVNGTTWRICI